jgi:hypothetical protein
MGVRGAAPLTLWREWGRERRISPGKERGKEVFVCIFASGYLPASDQVCNAITLQASEEVY